MSKYTYVVEKTCPICNEKTRATKLKSRLITLSTDEDYCVHYEGINPYFYRVWVCEHCGFAGDEKQFTGNEMSVREKQVIVDFLNGRKVNIPFSEERTADEAINAYKLAIFYAERVGLPLQRQAGYCMGMAWIYRDIGNEDKERETMLRAAELYEKSVMTERYPINGMSDTMAIYLTGAIYYRLGEFGKATQNISQIIGDKNVRVREPAVFSKAQNLWINLRELQKSQSK